MSIERELLDQVIAKSRRSRNRGVPDRYEAAIATLADERDRLAAQVAELVALLHEARHEVARGMPKQVYPATRQWLTSIDEALARIGGTP